MSNNRFIRTSKGTWVNLDEVLRIEITESQNDGEIDAYLVEIFYKNRIKHPYTHPNLEDSEFIAEFDTREAAQEYLDEMMMG